jgi:hypothetical protein
VGSIQYRIESYMTLADVPLPIGYAASRQYALVFTPQLAQRLAELHAEHGRPDCVAEPLPLVDGRYMMCADLLTATVPGGWLHAMWEAADKAILLPAVKVMPMADAEALRVPSPL